MAEVTGPAPLPAPLRSDWPVPWQRVWGDRDGAFDRALNRAIALALAATARAPERAVDAVIGGLARVVRRLDRGHREAAREFLRQALGREQDEATLDARVLQAYRHLFRVAYESSQLHRRLPLDERFLGHFELELCDDAERLRRETRGCVIASLHLGNWEAAAAVLPWLGFDPFYGVTKPVRNRPFSIELQRTRERAGVRVLPRRGSMRFAQTVIAAGGSIGLLLDQRARVKPILAPFFGRLARCDRSAAVLLRRLRAPVVVGGCYRTERPWHYRVRMPEVLWPDEVAGSTPEEIVGRIHRIFEELILAAPDQYFWLHDRYRGAPVPETEARSASA